MWVSKKKFRELEKRIADLEKQNRQVVTPIEIAGKEFAKVTSIAIRDTLTKF